MHEEAKSHMVVEAALPEGFKVKRYPQKAIEDALLLKLQKKQLVYQFVLK